MSVQVCVACPSVDRFEVLCLKLSQRQKVIKNLRFTSHISSEAKSNVSGIGNAQLGKLSVFQQIKAGLCEFHGVCAFVCVNLFFLPPLWSSGQSSWLQIWRPGFDSRHYQKKVVGLERGPLSLVSTIEELLDRKVAAPV
jgi:hypothetical protein